MDGTTTQFQRSISETKGVITACWAVAFIVDIRCFLVLFFPELPCQRTAPPVQPSFDRIHTCYKGHKALYALKSAKAGEVLHEFGYHALSDTATYLTVQVGDGRHIELSPSWLEHINHSCRPNVFFNTATFTLEALSDLAPGDELCFFYPSTEWRMSSPFECRCGAPSCLGLISGACSLSREQLGDRRVTDFIAIKLHQRDRRQLPQEELPQEKEEDEEEEKENNNVNDAAAGGADAHRAAPGSEAAARPVRVCVLQSSLEDCVGEFEGAYSYARPEAFDTGREFIWSHAHLRRATCVAQLMQLVRSGDHDVFLNLCDGAWDEDRAGRDVVELLERFNVPYTGADLSFYDPSRVQMKMCVQYYGLQVPPWVLIQAASRVEAGLAQVVAPTSRGGLRFPLLVKHPHGCASVGMTRAAKVNDEAQLRQQVQLMVSQFGGALVEEFIPGREFTVLVVEEPRSNGSRVAGAGVRAAEVKAETTWEADEPAFRPVAYTPVECLFGPGEDFKWHDYSTLQWKPCSDPELSERLKEAACSAFIANRGVGYGRCDFRVDPAGRIFFLEINPNCGVFGPPEDFASADFILLSDPSATPDPSGTPRGHMHFIRTIVNTAMERHRLKQKKVAPVFLRAATCGGAPSAGAPAATAKLREETNKQQAKAAAGGGPALVMVTADVAPNAAAEVDTDTDTGSGSESRTGSLISFGDTMTGGGFSSSGNSSNSVMLLGSRKSSSSASLSDGDYCAGSGTQISGGGCASDGETASGGAARDATVTGGTVITTDGGAARDSGGAGGWGLVALAPIRGGEVVQRREHRPQVIATKSFVQRCWPEGSRNRTWFEAYAWPISEEVWGTWSEDPADWEPINHSCDPNCWLVGLDVVARRDIAQGEQVTLDYATFCADHMAPFDCVCGAACCRGRITGSDYLAPWLGERYGSHVSAHVAAGRKRAAATVAAASVTAVPDMSSA